MKIDYECPSDIDKTFKVVIEDSLHLTVDCDDVDHPHTLALAEYVKDILINIPLNEKKLNVLLKKQLRLQWDSDEWLRDDYDNNYNYFLQCRGDIKFTGYRSSIQKIILRNKKTL